MALIAVETNEAVATVTLNRPKALNAINRELFQELRQALHSLDGDKAIRVIVLTGAGKAFCAGADIAELSAMNGPSAFEQNFLRDWADCFLSVRTPIIAAVNGYALGGGLELAMMCDIIYASHAATFGLPEIKLGTIPGGGGTQRLSRLVGRSKAMEMVLTGGRIDAQEARDRGLVASTWSHDEFMDQVMAKAKGIASHSGLVLKMAKEAVNAADTNALPQGLELERRLYHLSFTTRDFVEGTSAFLEKRVPNFRD